MPLLKFHIKTGWSQDQVDRLLDTTHEVMVETFKVPERDRYQIVNEHAESHFRALDTGLGFDRTEKFVLIEIVSRPRPKEQKIEFYERLSQDLERECRIAPTDLMFSFITNSDEDWSFGQGRAQFLTGEL